MRQLFLQVKGGFTNRLRAIVSAVLWAEDLDCELTLYWPVEPGYMPCELDELIERNSIPRLKDVQHTYLHSAIDVLNPETIKNIIEYSNQDISIKSDSEFHPQQRTSRGLILLRGLRVKEDLEHEADRLWKLLGGKSSWLGVHYRGIDYANPVEYFFPYLNNEKEGCFLVTDDIHVKNMFVERYTIRTINSDVGRHTPLQQKHSVIEWLLLHKCGRVLQSVGSSYSELVTLRSGGTLIRVYTSSVAISPITSVTQDK